MTQLDLVEESQINRIIIFVLYSVLLCYYIILGFFKQFNTQGKWRQFFEIHYYSLIFFNIFKVFMHRDDPGDTSNTLHLCL